MTNSTVKGITNIKEPNITWIPETPGGRVLSHLRADTEGSAWNQLLEDVPSTPYLSIEGLMKRGYRVTKWRKE